MAERLKRARMEWTLLSRRMRHGILRLKRAEWLPRAGYYAGIIALLALLGTASTAYRNRGEKVEAPAATPRVVEASVQQTPAPTPQWPRWVWPISGEIIGGYLTDALSYNSALGQWQTHEGLDIAALPGEAVLACGDGTVSDAYKDALWGNVIVVDHPDGLRSVYANLNTLNLVEIGQSVKAGEVIGSVGRSAACESDLDWHLHFEVRRGENAINFEDLIDSRPE